MLCVRAVSLSLGCPGWDRPDTSPLTSARNTGTPAPDSCSAMSCSVFVLPVPVQHAERNPYLGLRHRFAVDEEGPQLEGLAGERVSLGDLVNDRVDDRVDGAAAAGRVRHLPPPSADEDGDDLM